MALDVNACLKALAAAFSQYRARSTDQTVKDLERQIDVLIGISSGAALSGFNSKEILPAECLSSLVSLLNENVVNHTLHLKAMVLLFNLSADLETRDALHSGYHLTSTLASFLQRNQVTNNEKIVLQSLQLLQRITYCSKITSISGSMEELIRFLVKHIQMPESEMTIPCLGLLANLCRHHMAVQAHIKAMDNVKSLYRMLISYLSHANLTVIIFSLSILTSLSLNEQLGEKLFNSKNIHQTFQLVFNILINGEGSLTRKYSVDLFVDLLESPKIQQSLMVHEHLAYYLEQILTLLTNISGEESAKVLELLLTFCTVSGMRSLLCKTLLAPDVAKAKGDHDPNELYNAVLFWCSQPIEAHPTVSLCALDFIKEMFEEIIDSNTTKGMSSRVSSLAPLLMGLLTPPAQIDGPGLKKRCEQTSKALDVISAICFDSSLRKSMLKHLQLEQCWKVVEYQYQHNTLGTRSSLQTSWGEDGVRVVLRMLHLMCSLKASVPGVKENLFAALQDQRLVPLLAHALTCGARDSVQKALRILSEATTLPDFQMIWLGEIIASNNSAREVELTTLRGPGDEEFSPPPSPPRSSTNQSARSRHVASWSSRDLRPAVMTPKSNVTDANIECLIEKMRSGLEIKDPKASEIIDIYEAKLSSLMTKESHLQDLLEAKALAVAQADRLISQYRCRRAQSEAECSKLRKLLSETEKKNEAQTEQIMTMLESQKAATIEMETLLRTNENLSIIAEEHKQLKKAFAEISQRLETSQRSLLASQDEIKALTELSEMRRRHNDNLKIQHDTSALLPNNENMKDYSVLSRSGAIKVC
ncbi:protein CIP2A homolog isoform X2 [Nematostella vectensis]|uniref:protein CIP2A homolog isoform X2 n=1 Tax=Nematostella vectensis TaxID=45351 RepID=UPI0013906713|nr:protein CIP2A homolog isoform X2 [Nematostella vectensis]